MGLMDLVQAEETVSIKVSEYRELIENNTELELFRKLYGGTASERLLRMLRAAYECAALTQDERDELEAYRASGITPDRFKVIDDEYQKLSKDNARLTDEKAWLFDQVKALEQKCKELDESNQIYHSTPSEQNTKIEELMARVNGLRSSIRYLRAVMQSKTAEIEDLKKKLVERDAHIDELLSMMQGSEAEGDGE